MNNEKHTLTTDEALAMLPEGERIHTFRGGGMMMIGADWDRDQIETAIRDHDCELAGGVAAGMGHRLYVHEGRGLFVATAEAD